MVTIKCKIVMSGEVTLNSDELLSVFDVRDTIEKYGFNVIHSRFDVSNFHPEKLLSVQSVEAVEVEEG